jgi:hypothetical protein
MRLMGCCHGSVSPMLKKTNRKGRQGPREGLQGFYINQVFFAPFAFEEFCR